MADGELESPERIFLQFLNPEIVALYGLPLRFTPPELYQASLHLTRYAVLLARDLLVIPASFLFEVPFMPRLLKELGPIASGGLLHYTSTTGDLGHYAQKKSVEYRDELPLFPGYSTEVRGRSGTKLPFLPRTNRSASTDIGSQWRRELESPDGLWQSIIRSHGNDDLSTDIETQIERVPDILDGRAFIHRYAMPHVPIALADNETTELSMMLSREYLKSYLVESRATIFSDTRLGLLDCAIQSTWDEDRPPAISFRRFYAFLRSTGFADYIDRWLANGDLVELRESALFRRVIELGLLDIRHPNMPVSHALARSRQMPSEIHGRHLSSKTRLHAVHEHAARFLDAVEPYLPGSLPYIADEGASLERVTRRARSRTKPSSAPDAGQAHLKGEVDPVVSKNDVFLVHGRDSQATEGMRQMLGAAKLNVVEWEEAVHWTGKTNPFILEVLQVAFTRVQAVVVLLTPDEDVRLKPQFVRASDGSADREPQSQPRPNVLVELGMALALYPIRTLLVQIGQVREVSDLAGMHAIRFTGSPQDRNDVIERLKTAGCEPNTRGGRYFDDSFFAYLKSGST